jgi:hypothetical protein
MSEYQYYEFAAVDGPVTEDESPYPYSVSSRAEWEDEAEASVREAECEPPVPPGLDALTPAQRQLAEQLLIAEDYLAAAAALAVPAVDHAAVLRSTLARLDAGAMRAYLLRVAEGGATRVVAELNRLARCPGQPVAQRQRTCAELLAAVEEHRLTRERREEGERNRRRREKEAKRKAHLESLMQRAESVWREVDSLVECKTGSAYDGASQHLRELRDAYALAGRMPEYGQRLQSLRERNARRPALLGRLAKLQSPPRSTPTEELTGDDGDDQ